MKIDQMYYLPAGAGLGDWSTKPPPHLENEKLVPHRPAAPDQNGYCVSQHPYDSACLEHLNNLMRARARAQMEQDDTSGWIGQDGLLRYGGDTYWLPNQLEGWTKK